MGYGKIRNFCELFFLTQIRGDHFQQTIEWDGQRLVIAGHFTTAFKADTFHSAIGNANLAWRPVPPSRHRPQLRVAEAWFRFPKSRARAQHDPRFLYSR